MAKKGGLSQAIAKVAAKKNYYWIFGIEEETPDFYTAPEHRYRPFVVNFGVSNDPHDLDGHNNRSRLAPGALEDLLTGYYRDAANPPRFELDVSKNWHTARTTTREAAEQLASEIVYILRNAGMEPMSEEKGVYPAKIPGSQTVVDFPPARQPRP